MCKTKFTPGPWEFCSAQPGFPYEPTKDDLLRYVGDCWDDGVEIDNAREGWGIARSKAKGSVICVFGNGPTTEANAHLIAAAPELYEAGDEMLWLTFDPREHSVDRFERIGELFYKETGYLRPGKSYPLSMTPPDDLDRIFGGWMCEKQSRAIDRLKAALAKARGEK